MITLFYLIITFSIILIYLLVKSTKRPQNYPPGPALVPFVGNALELRKEARHLGGQHFVFENWAKQFGTNVLGLKLGSELVVVVRSHDLVHKVQIDEVFEGRPDSFFLRLRTMGTRSGITCTDGPLWYEHRNLITKLMRNIGYGRSQMEQHIEEEAKNLVEYIAEMSERPIWPGAFLATNVLNVLWRLVASKRFERNDEQLNRLLDLLNKRSKAFDMSGGALTQFPWLRFIAPERTGYNLIQKLNHELYAFFMETINEHKENFSENIEKLDLIYRYLSDMEVLNSENKKRNMFNETQLVMTILDLFIAGSQTTSNTIDIAFMSLALNPDVQRKIFKEIELFTQTNGGKFPHLGLRTQFPYTNSFLMEINRYFHIVPISGPRRALYHTKLDGYDIPQNTTILIDLRSVHKDEKHWRDAEEFRPERFLDKEGNLRKDDYLMPFGVGRRRCLGDTLARACIFSFLTSVLQNFEIVTCDEEKPSLVLQPGITLSAKPYKVRFLKR